MQVLPLLLAVVGSIALVISLVVTVYDAVQTGDDLDLANACNRTMLHANTTAAPHTTAVS